MNALVRKLLPLLLSGISLNVAAATFGSLSVSPETYLQIYSPGSFGDAISFTLSDPSTVYVSTKEISAPGLFLLIDGSGVIGTPAALGSNLTFSGLSSGLYAIIFGGTAGSPAGVVSIAANAVPAVPEPNTSEMLIAGAVMLGLITRRRFH